MPRVRGRATGENTPRAPRRTSRPRECRRLCDGAKKSDGRYERTCVSMPISFQRCCRSTCACARSTMPETVAKSICSGFPSRLRIPPGPARQPAASRSFAAACGSKRHGRRSRAYHGELGFCRARADLTDAVHDLRKYVSHVEARAKRATHARIAQGTRPGVERQMLPTERARRARDSSRGRFRVCEYGAGSRRFTKSTSPVRMLVARTLSSGMKRSRMRRDLRCSAEVGRVRFERHVGAVMPRDRSGKVRYRPARR